MLHLATDGLGQFVDKLNQARVFVGGSGLLHVMLYLFDESLVGLVAILLAEHDGGFHYLSVYLVGYTGNGTFEHGRMFHQCTLHLEGTYAVA